MPRHAPANSSQRRAQDSPSFPKDFTTIRDLLDGAVSDGEFVSLVGIVKDYRPPISSLGTDYKCTITLYDSSTEYDNEGIDVFIFRKKAEMPEVGAGDVVMVFMAKVQSRNGTYSLLSNSRTRTDIHVYDVQLVTRCKKSGSARGALKEPTRKVDRDPDAKQNEYVLWMFERMDKSLIPDQQEFSERKLQSMNVKDKFSLLQDVRDRVFADLVVQVVKEPWDQVDKVSLWVSDYTENAKFFLKTSDSTDWTHDMRVQDGDPFGYTNGRKKPLALTDDEAFGWDGPTGKKSLQLTCWEPHAGYITKHVHKGDWLRLRNVQIGFGRNSMNLEGFLREDRRFPDRVYAQTLQVHADRETVDPRLVEALRRKRDYEKAQKLAHKSGGKRKPEEPVKKENAKTKRQKRRENQQKAKEQEQATKEAALGISDIVVSEHQDKDIVPLPTILKPVLYTTTIADQEVQLELPFTCATYRTNVRVVDFKPASLKNFAVGRTITEYDLLSDNEDSESDTPSSPSSAHSSLSQPNERRTWEWRFALKLEEVSASLKPTQPPAQTWAVVNNFDAQLLLNLDATNLHAPQNAAIVRTLRERLFKLWGNLEERKARLETKRQQHILDPLRAPPPDSSDGEDGGLRGKGAAAADDVPGSQLSNRPFTCCLRQYGVKVRAEEGEVATAGDGRKWQRVFGLFGTKIKDD